MAEDGPGLGGSPATTLEHPPTAPPPNPSRSRKSTLEASMFDIHVTGTTTPSSTGYGQQNGARHVVEFDEYFVSLQCTF